MIKIENVVMPSPEQWFAVIRGMRNSRNSWDKSDSYKEYLENQETSNTADFEFHLGDNDHKLMLDLCGSGTDHRKFMRMIPVYLDITAPLYWWKEFDTYKVGTVANSCSTMHKIAEKEFTLEDFSTDNLITRDDDWDDFTCEMIDGQVTLNNCAPSDVLQLVCNMMNFYRNLYLTEEHPDDKEIDWWQIIQLLPSSYNQRRTVMLNYEVLSNIYKSRKNHKLNEWRDFCDWIKCLRYSDLITGEKPKAVEADTVEQAVNR